jgi:formiminoglutamate deiminase
VQWLLDNTAVDARWCLVHATHMTEDEISRLARSGAVAGFCPVTEANLGDGIAPAAPFVAAGGTFGIGTDSNVLISAREELRALEYGQRLRDRARNVMAAQSAHSTGRTLFAHAQRGGARALGVNDGRGESGLVVGAAADCVSLRSGLPAMPSRPDDVALDSFIFGADDTHLDDVWRAGRRWVERGVHCAREAVVARYKATLARLVS